MSLIIKIMSADDLPDVSPYKGFSLHTDIASVTFVTQKGAEGEPDFSFARAYVTDKTKTAMVPGFCEHEQTLEIPPNTNVYVMNENGKTISSWTSPGVDGKFPSAAMDRVHPSHQVLSHAG